MASDERVGLADLSFPLVPSSVAPLTRFWRLRPRLLWQMVQAHSNKDLAKKRNSVGKKLKGEPTLHVRTIPSTESLSLGASHMHSFIHFHQAAAVSNNKTEFGHRNGVPGFVTSFWGERQTLYVDANIFMSGHKPNYTPIHKHICRNDKAKCYEGKVSKGGKTQQERTYTGRAFNTQR